MNAGVARQLGLAGPGRPLLVFFTRILAGGAVACQLGQVGPTQFADLWEMYAGLAARMEVSPLPDLYVTKWNGVVNAYALSCSSRWKYVSINAELGASHQHGSAHCGIRAGA